MSDDNSAALSADEWIPLFTQWWPDEKLLDPAFCMTFDHCKLCDTHVDRGEQKNHLRQHKRELKSYRNRLRDKRERERRANLIKARKVRST